MLRGNPRRKSVDIDNKEELLARLKKTTVITPEGHWLWTGTSVYGYGSVRIANKEYRVHRLSMYIFKDLDLGKEDHQALHTKECSHRGCWNPDHLYIGSHLDNMRDYSEIIQSTSTYPCGHPRTEVNTDIASRNTEVYTPIRVCRTCHLLSGSKRKSI